MTAPERHQAAILKAVKAGNTTVPELVQATKLRAHQVRNHANSLVKAGKLDKTIVLVGDSIARSRTCKYSVL